MRNVSLYVLTSSQKSSSVAHKRTKRRWRPLPFSIIENDSPPFPKELEMVRHCNMSYISSLVVPLLPPHFLLPSMISFWPFVILPILMLTSVFIFSQISSDSSVNYTVYYQISGQGVTTDPKELFILNKYTGMLSVTRAVDREQYPQFNVSLNISGLMQKQCTRVYSLIWLKHQYS